MLGSCFCLCPEGPSQVAINAIRAEHLEKISVRKELLKISGHGYGGRFPSGSPREDSMVPLSGRRGTGQASAVSGSEGRDLGKPRESFTLYSKNLEVAKDTDKGMSRVHRAVS